jgi:hypothetical protein
MARIGNVAAAPFVGDEFASLYLGATRVPTVPGKPVIDPTSYSEEIVWGSANNGGGGDDGTANVYVNGSLSQSIEDVPFGLGGVALFDPALSPGDVVRVSFVNAIGEGPLSDPFVIPTGSAAATLYFNGAVDSDWAEVGNWWLDEEHTEPAGRLPASADSAVVSANVGGNSGDPITVANLTMESAVLSGLQITVTGVATFNGGSILDGGVIGNAIFNNNSGITEAEVEGNVVFNDTSFFSGDSYITGNATFNDNARMDAVGDVSGTATFTGSACYVDGTAGTFVPDPPPEC